METQLKPFYSAVKNPAAIARTMKKKGRPVIGHLCSYAPEELIFAAGGHPMRLSGAQIQTTVAQNHLQTYCCDLARQILEQGLCGKLDYLDGIVFPHTCDTIQRLSDIWRLNIPMPFFADIVLPVKLDTVSGFEYMQVIFDTFVSDLSAFTQKTVTQADLENAIHLFNQIRHTLSCIYETARQNPGSLSGQDLLTVTKGCMIMDKEACATCLSDLACAMKTAEKSMRPTIPVLLSGSFCDTPELYSLIEASGGFVAGDDLCSGMRGFDGSILTNIGAIKAVAKRYTDRLICPAKHRGTTARAKTLIDQVQKTRARGIIFTLLKFCDPHAFDLPYLKSSLDKAGIPSLCLELDGSNTNPGQMATRIETFIQMI